EDRDKMFGMISGLTSSLERFGGRSVARFMAGNGVTPAKGGFMQFTDNAVVLRVEDLCFSGRESATDSTMLMLMELAEAREYRNDSCFMKYCPTSSMAVVVSGDVNRDRIISKLGMLSYMVPRRQGEPVSHEWKWNPSAEASYVCHVDPNARIGSVRIRYVSPRTPSEYMSTVLPTVSERLGDLFGLMVRKRAYGEFLARNIPIAGIGYEYVGSCKTGEDEQYVVTVYTSDEHLAEAVRVMGHILAEFDVKGVETEEYSEAKEGYMVRLYEQSEALYTNKAYIDKCISSFLYGSDLASKKSRFEFYASGRLPEEQQTGLFNDFAAELLDRQANLTLTCTSSTPVLSEEELAGIFDSAWLESAESDSRIRFGRPMNVAPLDSISLPSPLEKIKVKTIKTDPISGGSFWVFANGVKVVYKRMPTDGLFYYSLLVRGGYSAMKDIRRGEGAFVSDMLELYDIAGLSSQEFNYLMMSNGITMESDVRMAETMLYGTATRPNLSLLFKGLLAVANERSVNRESFSYYAACQKLVMDAAAGSAKSRIAGIDAILCPQYLYSPHKVAENLHPDLPEKAMIFFDEQFSHVNDGVFVLVGDMEETAMRRMLQDYVGGFRTERKTAPAVKLNFQPISGWITHTEEGAAGSIDVAMSAPVQYSAENCFAAKIAGYVLKDALNNVLCDEGLHTEVASDVILFPQERYNVLISIEGADMSILSKVRNAISDAASMPVSDAGMSFYRQKLSNEILSSEADPWHWIWLVNLRYADGKDLNSKWQSKVNAVSAEQVRQIIADLEAGSKVEYIVNRWNTQQ
ncbi:MAG: hypothetical protein ACI4TM_02305, partial [Candidatus Cryptobacteroides sp.]